MIPDPPRNGVARPYRGLSVQEVDVPLGEIRPARRPVTAVDAPAGAGRVGSHPAASP